MEAFTSKRLRRSFAASADKSGSTASEAAQVASAGGTTVLVVPSVGADGRAEEQFADEATVAEADAIFSASL